MSGIATHTVTSQARQGKSGSRLRQAGLVTALAAAVALAACGPQNGAPMAQQAPGTVAAPVMGQQPVQGQQQYAAPQAPTQQYGTQQYAAQQPMQQRMQQAPVAVQPAPQMVQAQPVQQAQPQQAAPRADLGQVSSVEPIVSAPSSTGAGAVIGGVLGGVLGHQVGGGTGKKVATVAGAVGGAFAGNAVERSRSEHVTGYRVHVQLDNGRSRSFTLRDAQTYRVGDRVRVVDGSLRPA